MRIEFLLALLYPIVVGLVLFGILRWARRERTRLMQQRPGAKLSDGDAEIAQGRIAEGYRLYLLGDAPQSYAVLAHVLIVFVLSAVAALIFFLVYAFLGYRL